VSFNGKSFDAPLLETRYLFHRLEWIGAALPHLDVLHPARRFWGSAIERAFHARVDCAGGHVAHNCSLVGLERQVLGVRRTGDVPGFEIPSRYFQFVRSGDGRPIAAVLEHNRLDLLSLAGLTARLLHLVSAGASAACDAREALALGRLYTRAGLDARAREAYEHALSRASMERARSSLVGVGSSVAIHIESARALAVCLRRARRFDEAAACWRQLLDVGGCPPHVAREATEALAIHHEHRVRDLAAAKVFALRNLETGIHQGSAGAHREEARTSASAGPESPVRPEP
jgi:hypothetical protein